MTDAASWTDVAQSWDVEYQSGRYRDEAPVQFVEDILAVAQDHGLIGSRGLYVGCGNGRNYLPLVAGGLDLTGLDISSVAIDQLARRAPKRRQSLFNGDLTTLPPDLTYPIVIGIQVFQHGNRAQSHDHIRSAQSRLERGGLFCLRVNAVGSDLVHRHRVVESDADGGVSVHYENGPKTGLDIHFFAGRELALLFQEYTAVLGPRVVNIQQDPPKLGHWVQWEAIWYKPR